MKTALLVGALMLAMVTACGEEGAERTADAAAATAAKPDPKTEIRQAAEGYLKGISDQNFKAACEAWAPSERKAMAVQAGSCEKLFQVLLKEKPGMSEVFSDAKAADVRIKGSIAGVDIVQPGQTEPATTLAAILENGHWYIGDVPDSKIP